MGLFVLHSILFFPDPATDGQESQSLFQYGNNNPLRFIDPDGNIPKEYDVDVNTGTVRKVSDLGGNEVDFYHYHGGDSDGKTRILDLKSFIEQWMSSSKFMV